MSEDMKEKICKDIDDNTVRAGDSVEYYDLIGCKGDKKVGVVWVVGDMNEKQTNMPYIKGAGAWHPKAIRKIIDE